jgi:hypothetical protein
MYYGGRVEPWAGTTLSLDIIVNDGDEGRQLVEAACVKLLNSIDASQDIPRISRATTDVGLHLRQPQDSGGR